MRAAALAAIGSTPLVRLGRMFPDAPIELYAKLEYLNPGGSMKDRAALQIILGALSSGLLSPGMTVIESSSGNMGIGLAQACLCNGLHLICVVDPRTSIANVDLLRAYGAEIEVVETPDPTTGEYLPARLSRVHELLATIPRSWWSNQYGNPDNPAGHKETVAEILRELDQPPSYLFCPVSTCGMVRGFRDALRGLQASTQIVAVDAVGSRISSQITCVRRLPGLGAAIRPALYYPEVADRWIQVDDCDVVRACRELLCREGLLAGGSSGAVMHAIQTMLPELPKGSTCVAILADRGERYMDTIYSDSWTSDLLHRPTVDGCGP